MSVKLNSKIEAVVASFKSNDGDVISGLRLQKGQKSIWLTFQDMEEMVQGFNALKGTIKQNLDFAAKEVKDGYKINWDGSSTRPQVQQEVASPPEQEVVSKPTTKTVPNDGRSETNVRTMAEAKPMSQVLNDLADF